MAWYWAALLVGGAAFLGSFVGAAWGSYPPEPQPRHPKTQKFPVDLDELDKPHAGDGDL